MERPERDPCSSPFPQRNHLAISSLPPPASRRLLGGSPLTAHLLSWYQKLSCLREALWEMVGDGQPQFLLPAAMGGGEKREGEVSLCTCTEWSPEPMAPPASQGKETYTEDTRMLLQPSCLGCPRSLFLHPMERLHYPS